MDMAKKTLPPHHSSLVLVWSYLALLLANSVVIYLASVVFPLYVVLGTFSLTAGWSLLHSMIFLTLLNVGFIPFVHEYEHTSGKMLKNTQWMALYFVINFVGVWVIARFSDQVGFGISSWLVAAVLAVVLNIVQSIVMMALEKLKSR